MSRISPTKIKAAPALLSVNFNQDSTCIATGTRQGYTITNCDPFGKVYEKSEGATSVVEMLFCTSLVALVGAGDRPNSSTRRLRIVNTKRRSTICELTFPTSVLAVRLNRKRLVVVLEERIYVYDISNMKLMHEMETSPNPNAICSLSPSSPNSYLAYPAPHTPSQLAGKSAAPSSSPGDVLIFDCISLSVASIIQAHKSPVAFLALNPTGTLLATASDKGTVIRVFTVPNGQKIHEFRRGSYAARIYSIAFNAVSTLLAVSSDTETVHIFKLTKGDQAKNGGKVPEQDFDDNSSRFSTEDGDSLGGYEAYIGSKQQESRPVSSIRRKSMSFGRNLAGSVGGFLPGAVTGIWDPQRDFAFLKLPTVGVRSVVALSNTTPHAMVVTSEGQFYSYAIDLENGGECVLQRTHSLLDGVAEEGSMGDA